MDYFLKAATEAELHAALVEAGILVELPDDQGLTLAGNVVLDTIGTISKPTGQTVTVDGVEVPEIAPIAGFHANLRGELSEAQLAILAPILLTAPPENPFRVWA